MQTHPPRLTHGHRLRVWAAVFALGLLTLVLWAPLEPPSAAGMPSQGASSSNSAPTVVEREVSALVRLSAPSVAVRLADHARTLQLQAGDQGILAAAARDAGPLVSRWDSEVAASQDTAVRAAEALGIRVVSRYTAAVNGLLVHGRPEALARLAQTVGVLEIEPAPLLKPALAHSVPFIGTDSLIADAGYDGAGSVVAVMDTGVDYTHESLGGPGVVGAFQAAGTDPAAIDEEWEGEVLFPNAKVIGGWDFVGQRYNTPEYCTPDDEATGRCITVPEPDADPLDGHGHGTHVAGIAAGLGTADGAVYHGVAPAADVVALKIYGSPPGARNVDEAVDVVIDGIEWCTRVNMGLAVPGVAPERVDAINMSLGESFAQGSFLFDEAVAAAVDAGIVVVASAGNAGNLPFVLGAPSASAKILSVASSTAPSDGYQVNLRWESGEIRTIGSEGDGTVPLTQAGRVEAEVGRFGRGCTDDPPADDVSGRAALVERGVCALVEKVQNAQAAGAVAVVMYTDDRPRVGILGSSEGITIPGVMIDRDPGLQIDELLQTGTPVTVTIDPASKIADTSTADIISSFSSRGPSKNRGLKPDITAPGSGIHSAQRASGSGGVSFNGTSMASPHVAGAAALMTHRNRAEALGLSALDLAAMLMNYAVPSVVATGPQDPPLAVSRQGAGRVDVYAAGTGDLVIRVGEIASVGYGPSALVGTDRVDLPVTIRNLGDDAKRLRIAPRFLKSEMESAVTFEAPDPILLDPRSAKIVTLSMRVHPEALPEWPFDGIVDNLGADLLDPIEIDGYLDVVVLDENAEPAVDSHATQIPFYVLARRASWVDTAGVPAGSLGSDTKVVFVNHAFYPGEAHLYWHVGTDPHEATGLRELDIKDVGVRFVPGVEAGTGNLDLAVSLWTPLTVPQPTLLSVLVDTDGDEDPEYRIRSGTERELTTQGSSSQVVVGVTSLESGEPVGAEAYVGSRAVDIESSVIRLTVPWSAVGLDGPATVGVAVEHSGLTEDWLEIDAPSDRAPDTGAFVFDPGEAPFRPDTWSVSIAPHTKAEVGLSPTASDADMHLLAVYPANDPEHGTQAAIVPNDGPQIGGQGRVYLPFAVARHAVKPLRPGERVHASIDVLPDVVSFQMIYDITDEIDREQAFNRIYLFFADRGVSITGRPKYAPGDQLQHIRFDDQGYYRGADGNWYCGVNAWYMFLQSGLADKLHAEFPRVGWTEDFVSDGIRQLRATSDDGSISYFAQIPEAGGPPRVLSWTLGEASDPARRHVYRFERYNDSSIEVWPPRGALDCP